MSQSPTSQMKTLIRSREKARKNLDLALNSITTNRSDSKTSRNHGGGAIKSKNVDAYLVEQDKFLEVEMKLIELAISGIAIYDQKERCERRNKNGKIQDISLELEQLFMLTTRPTKTFRSRLQSPIITPEKRNAILALLVKLYRRPEQTLSKIANRLAKGLLASIDDASSHQRMRKGLIRVVMYIGDYHRYLLRHKTSADAAQLMRVLHPQDPEAHMRLGMNLMMILSEAEPLQPFFHYCVFLANRNVPLDHQEAEVVKRNVQGCIQRLNHRRRNSSPSQNDKRLRFPDKFIDTVWTLLTGDQTLAQSKLKDKDLWRGFTLLVEDKASANEIAFVCGVLLFSHHRICPQNGRVGGIPPRREMCDYFLCKAINILAETIGKELESITAYLRNRKKNRRRAYQKKRKADVLGGKKTTSNQLGLEVLKGIDDLENRVPSLGSLCLLANYWSRTRGAPGPTTDLKIMSNTLHHLKKIEKEIENICEVTEVVSVSSHVTSKVLACTERYIPALEEDIRFSCFQFCHDLSLFQNTVLQEVPLSNIFENENMNIIGSALRSVQAQTYEILVAEPAKRHLEAFGQKCLQELGSIDVTPSKQSTAIIVSLMLRKYRMSKLIQELDRVGGGSLLNRIHAAPLAASDAEKSPNEMRIDDPPPEQQRFDPEIESLNPIDSREIQQALRKKRRLLGSCTPGIMDTGGSTPKSNERETGTLNVRRRLSLDEFGNDADPVTQNSYGTNIEPNRKRRKTDQFSRREPQPQRRTHTEDSGRYEDRQLLNTMFHADRSLRIRVTQSQERGANESKPTRWTDQNRRSEISKIIQRVLHPPNEARVTPPRDFQTTTFWREQPSEDYVQNCLQSASLSSSQ